MDIRRRFVDMSNEKERDAYYARGRAHKSRIRDETISPEAKMRFANRMIGIEASWERSTNPFPSDNNHGDHGTHSNPFYSILRFLAFTAGLIIFVAIYQYLG